MKINLILPLFAFLVFVNSSCKKHVIEYQTTDVTDVNAEFQLHYFVPVNAGADNNILKVELDGRWINENHTLLTYNAIPSGAVGRFYVTTVGKHNLKLYRGDDMELVYDQDFEFISGKQNIFVYDFDKAPVVIDNGYPYDKVITENTATTAWIKFYNFLFEKDNMPVDFKIQYEYQYTDDEGEKSDWINVGEPVAFGEATEWIPVVVYKTVLLSAGTARLDYRMEVINSDGSSGGMLQVLNSQGDMEEYSDWWNASIGRHYHHIFGGYRIQTPLSGIRQFVAL